MVTQDITLLETSRAPDQTQLGQVDTSPPKQTLEGAGEDQGQLEEPPQASLRHEGGRQRQLEQAPALR